MMDVSVNASMSAARAAMEALSVAASKWFLAMRDCIGRERRRQSDFREKNGLPKSARLAYERQPLTESESATALMSESLVRAMFGDYPAEYAKDKFEHALSTGDMRAFKIRLLFLKIRDSLKGSPFHRDFSNMLEDAISNAEEMAGCKPDPSPRRMSKAEKARREKRESARQASIAMQQELPLIWPGSESALSDESQSRYIEMAKNPCVEDLITDTSSKNDNCENSTISSDKNEEINTSDIKPDSKKCIQNKPSPQKPKKSSGKKRGSGIVRRAREYDSVDQIMEDVSEGKIVPYESTEQICEDVKSGAITPVEALMFTAALGRMSGEDPDIDAEIEKELGSEFQDEEEITTEDEDEDQDGEDDLYDDERGNRRNMSSAPFSYNPRGFDGCAGGYSASGAEWNRDDEW